MAINISFPNEPNMIDFYGLVPGEWFTSPSFPNVVFLKTDDNKNSENNAIGFEDGCEFGEYYSFEGDDRVATEVKFTMHVGGAE